MTNEQHNQLDGAAGTSAGIETPDSLQSTKLAWALRYAAHGWPVLPLHTVRDGVCTCGRPDCKSPGKDPRTAHGKDDATTDEVTIREWWSRWPDANIGCRVPDGLVVVDVDIHNGGSFQQLGNIPPTVRAKSGSRDENGHPGGYHLYFKLPEGTELGKSFQTLKGIDLRAAGKHYVVLPPSLHLSGYRYEWIEGAHPFGELPFAEMPQHLIDLTHENQNTVPTGTATVMADGPIAEGARNTTLTSLGGTLRGKGLTQSAIQAALLAQNRDRCNPPLPDNEVRAIAASVARYPAGQVSQAPTTTRPIAPQSLKELLGREIPEVRWAVPDLIPQGLTILAGRPKVGKSWLALALAIAVGSGGRAFGQVECEKGNVLYLALEDTLRRLKERTLRILGTHRSRWDGSVDFETTWEPLDRGGREQLESYLAAHTTTRLVVIDTFAKVRPAVRSKSGVSYDEDYRAMGMLKTLADQHQTAIVVIHHTRKGAADDPQDLVSGTTGLTGAADSTMVLTRGRVHSEQTASLFMTGRDIEERELVLAWQPESYSWVVTGESAEALRLTAQQRKVIDFFRTHNWQPCRRIDVLRGVGLDTTPHKGGYHLLDRMLGVGSLVRSGTDNIRPADYLRDTPITHTSTPYPPSTTSTAYTAYTPNAAWPETPIVSDVDDVDVVDIVDIPNEDARACVACGAALETWERTLCGDCEAVADTSGAKGAQNDQNAVTLYSINPIERTVKDPECAPNALDLPVMCTDASRCPTCGTVQAGASAALAQPPAKCQPHRVWADQNGLFHCRCGGQWALDDLPVGSQRFTGFGQDELPNGETWSGREWTPISDDERATWEREAA